MSSENSNNDNEECGKFPEGMRVLVVDDNIVCLNFISDLLIKCCYQVTPKQNSTEALALLTQNDDNYFDILLINVNKYEDEDAFNLLKVGFELDIPVILMSESDNKDMIMKGIRYGAKDFLLKPIHMEEIKVIWRHVYCKNIKSFLPKPKTEPCDVVINGVDEEMIGDGGKRERVRWTRELHDQFVEAVQKLGGVDKAVPKKILDMMGCQGYMTREKVASHLQKYRKAIIKSKKVQLEPEVIRKKKNLPLQYQNPCSHSHLHPSTLASNSKLVGSNIQEGLLGPTTMVGFNYPRHELGNVVINGRFGNGGTTNFGQPLGTIEANNSILAQFDNHHYHYQLQTSTPQQQQQHYLDVKGLESLGFFESSVANEVDNNSCVISDDFFNEICPSLLDI